MANVCLCVIEIAIKTIVDLDGSPNIPYCILTNLCNIYNPNVYVRNANENNTYIDRQPMGNYFHSYKQ